MLDFPPGTRFEVFDGGTPLADTAVPAGYAHQAVHLTFQLPPSAPLPHTSHRWLLTSDVPGEGAMLYMRTVNFGYARTLPAFLAGGIRALVLAGDETFPPFAVTFPRTVALPALKRFLAAELAWPYEPAERAIALYRGAGARVREFGKYGLTAEFSSNASTAHAISVQLLEMSEEELSRSQLFVVTHQDAAGASGSERRRFLPEGGTVGDVLEAFGHTGPGLRVFRVVDHLIADALSVDAAFPPGDHTLLVVENAVVSPVAGERVLRAAHAVVHGVRLKPFWSPFFVRLILAEKVPAFIAQIQREMEIPNEAFKKLSFLVGEPHPRYSAHVRLAGEGPVSDALAPLRGVADLTLFVVHPPEGKYVTANNYI
jgi:hypothetical protein